MKRINFKLGKKNIPAFLIAIGIVIYGIISSVDGLTYFFNRSEPVKIGDVLEMGPDTLKGINEGDFIELKGITSVHGGSLKRGLWGEKYIVFYMSGSPKFIIIEKADEKIQQEGPQFRTIKGRAHGFKTNSQAAKMKDFFSKSFLIDMHEDGFLIESGVVPGKDYSSLVIFAGMIVLLFLTIFLFVKSLKTNKETMENDSDDI